MSLFGKKKKNETPACTCNCDCSASEAPTENTKPCCEKDKDGICCIKILGGGCKSCKALYENTQKAVTALGLSVEVEYITDMQKVMKYGVMSMPALVVNHQVAGVGKVYKPDEVVALLRKLGYVK